MAELILLSLSRQEFTQLHKSYVRGDQQAGEALKHLWDGYEERDDLACFICDELASHPIVCQVLPENRIYEKLIAAPLCQRCFDLPNMVRLSRALRILKRMYCAQTGKHITFSINNQPKAHPR